MYTRLELRVNQKKKKATNCKITLLNAIEQDDRSFKLLCLTKMLQYDHKDV